MREIIRGGGQYTSIVISSRKPETNTEMGKLVTILLALISIICTCDDVDGKYDKFSS
jgi:hypothetical protein